VIGEAPAPIAVVTYNRPCFRGVTFADALAGDDRCSVTSAPRAANLAVEHCD
jgi:hypothetical protein